MEHHVFRDGSGSCRSSRGTLLVWLRRHAQVRTQRLIAFREALLDLVFILERRHDHHIATLLPVGWRSHLMVIGQLQLIDHPQDLIEVTSRAGWVRDDQPDLFVRVDDKQRANRQRVVRVRMDHVVQARHFPIFIGNNGKVDGGLLSVCLLYTSPSPRD